MRGLSWSRTDNDNIILGEMREYAVKRNGCYCMFPNIKLTVNNTHPKKIKVNIHAKTRIKEDMVYYALCNIAQDYGAYAI
jgi:hypothetical protein